MAAAAKYKIKTGKNLYIYHITLISQFKLSIVVQFPCYDMQCKT